MSKRDADTTSLDFGIYNLTGQTLWLAGETHEDCHWHNWPPGTIASGDVAYVTAGSNSYRGTNVTVAYRLADGTVTFGGEARISVLTANFSWTSEDPETDEYDTEGRVGDGSLNVTGHWKFCKT